MILGLAVVNRHLQVDQVLCEHPCPALDSQVQSPDALVVDLKRICAGVQECHKRVLVVREGSDAQGSHTVLLGNVKVVALADQGG